MTRRIFSETAIRAGQAARAAWRGGTETAGARSCTTSGSTGAAAEGQAARLEAALPESAGEAAARRGPGARGGDVYAKLGAESAARPSLAPPRGVPGSGFGRQGGRIRASRGRRSGLGFAGEAALKQIAHEVRETRVLNQALIKELQEGLGTLSHQVQETGQWSLEFARRRMKEALVEAGHTPAQAEILFKELDAAVDSHRRLLNLPYLLGLLAVAIAVPAQIALVYNKDFHQKVLERFPHLEDTSWDWSEPLVQSALTVQAGIALALAALAALRVIPYRQVVDQRLVKQLTEAQIPEQIAKRFIKVDKPGP